MSSTAVVLHNESDINIYSELKWGVFQIASATIPEKAKGRLPCEYVWYDLYVYKDIAAKPLKASRHGVYGYSSWVFRNKPGVPDEFEIVPD